MQVKQLEYNSSALLAGRLIDDTRSLNSYNDQILRKLKSLYLKRKIDVYEYSHLVNILTCVSLKLDDVKGKLNALIDVEVRSSSIDIRI